ncbi:MAG: HlyC/CorC family transporter [Alphaproteobacteria bacterium]|nr:HlyC/CorC family transporter [Alphaproteobacteria bacterium]
MEPALLVSLIAIGVLLVLSAFFSGSETAITAASRSRLHHLAREGSQRARLVNRLIEDREHLIGTLLVGNNVVNIAASTLATGLLIALFGDAGVAYATVAMTILVVIFGEVAPKTYAIRNADRVALAVAPALRVVLALLTPVTRLVQRVVRGGFALAGIAAAGTDPAATFEELRGAIDLHTSEGSMERHEKHMIGSILDLDELEVGEVMVHRTNMVTVDIGSPPAEIVQAMLKSPHTRVPVWEREPDNIIGVLHAKDLLRAVSAHAGPVASLDIRAILSKPWFVPETTTLYDQLQAFRQRRAHFALVVDEYGAIMGLVTLEDIVEEIVGDIVDEHDVAIVGVKSLPDGSLLVDGAVPIRDLNRQFDWSLPDAEATTIAGLVIHEARQIPEPGQKFTFHGIRFEVLQRKRNRITALRLTPVPAAAPPATA